MASKREPCAVHLLYQKAIVADLTRFIGLDSETEGMNIIGSNTTLIVMIAWSPDDERRKNVKQFLERDTDLFDQIIVVTNKSSWEKNPFENDYLFKGWKAKIHLRIYPDNTPENAGVMRYRCFHAANEIPVSGEKQIVLIRDDRRFIYPLKGPGGTTSIPKDSHFNSKFKERLENIRTGNPMPTFSTVNYGGLKDNEIMSIPGQQVTASANTNEPIVEQGDKGTNTRPKYRNSSSDFPALTQGLFITLPTINKLWSEGLCYPPGPILEDYLWADMVYNAGLKARKAAAFLLRTGDFESIARPGDTQRKNEKPVQASTCWDDANALWARHMADGLQFNIDAIHNIMEFCVGGSRQEFSMAGKTRGGGAFHSIAAFILLQEVKNSVIKEEGYPEEYSGSLKGTIFERYGLPKIVEDQHPPLVRAESASRYADIHNRFLKKRKADEIADDDAGDKITEDEIAGGEIAGVGDKIAEDDAGDEIADDEIAGDEITEDEIAGHMSISDGDWLEYFIEDWVPEHPCKKRKTGD